MLGTDPLKIYYLLVLEQSGSEGVTAFQGFSISWRRLHWALHLLCTLPADVLEKSYKIDDVIAQRLGNLRPLYWLPVNLSALEQLTTKDIGVFIVCFSGEPICADRVNTWIQSQPGPVLHVSTEKIKGACQLDDFNPERLRQYCNEALQAHANALDRDRREAAETRLAKWADPELVPSGLRELSHNVLIPNHMSLMRAGRSLEKGEPFIGQSEAEYTAKIVESISAVFRVREQIGIRPLHRMSLLDPGLILTEPAFFRHAYKRIKPKGPLEEKIAAKTLRHLQSQKGLYTPVTKEHLEGLLKSPTAQMLVAARQSELETHTLGVGLKAAQTCSAVMRLSPGVNHVFPALSAYAQNARSNKLQARLKARRLFDNVQRSLRDAVGEERIALVEEKGGPIKIISDAPIEWLPVGNLPLALRYDCSRINATPGNLMMGQLTNAATITFRPHDLQKILVLTAFTEDDPLKEVLTGSIETIRDDKWRNKAELVYRTARNRAEFVSVLNDFDGYIMIFDGHGADNADEPVGKLILGEESVDVWELRGTVRIPPIIILSACDTHGIDASSQATVGNGFLALDARTVLATLLPVGGLASASFIARLVYRISDFLPAALAAEERVLNWTEVIAGMLRMLLATEMLDHMVGPPAPPESPRGQIQLAANMDINSGEPAWFDNLLERIAEHRHEDLSAVVSRFKNVLARCEAIRYVQLGNPETILIDDGRIGALVRREYSAGGAS